ncbi:MAG: DMT family transporter [Chitinophagia bacterium]|nr:DMT family transporter [Chitinophagia bacterium]
MQSSSHRAKAIAAVLAANFFFGTSVVAVKHVSPALIHPMALTGIRIFCAGSLFWLLYLTNPVATGIQRKDYVRLFFCAMAGIAINQSFSITGMSLTSPIHASLLILTTPITITILAAIFLRESLTAIKIAGLLLGMLGGSILVFSRNTQSTLGSDEMQGDLFVIGGALGYSSYVILIKPLMSKYQPLHILQWVFFMGGLVIIPLSLPHLQKVSWTAFTPIHGFCIAYVVLGGTFFAYLFMNYAIRILGAATTGAFIFSQPFFGTAAAILILHEPLTTPKILAAVCIIGGVLLANYKRN